SRDTRMTTHATLPAPDSAMAGPCDAVREPVRTVTAPPSSPADRNCRTPPMPIALPETTPSALRERRAVMNRALEARVPAGHLVVVPYVLTRPGHGREGHLAELRQLADHQGWRLCGAESDDCGGTDPAVRPGWARAVRALADGRAHAVAAVSQVTVSAHPALYARELDRIRDTGGALFLLRPETHL
ncbi:hypothetical protein, partial [Streptomyces clavuligerus]